MPKGSPDVIPPEGLLADYPPGIREQAERLRAIVRRTIPEAEERVRPGWRLIGYDLPIERHGVFFAWIWPQLEHVHLGFVHGVLIADPAGHLEGDGVTRHARWLTYRPGDPIDEGVARELLREAAAHASLPSAARRAALADRAGEIRR